MTKRNPPSMGTNKTMYWGYLHVNGELILKRWLGDVKDYTDDCMGNPFVVKVAEPFEAETWDEAKLVLNNKLG